MSTIDSVTTVARATAASELPALIDVIGDPAFEPRLHRFLARICDADHFGVFRMGDGEVHVLAADPTPLAQHRLAVYQEQQMWRLDPVLRRAMQPRGSDDTYLVRPDMMRDVDPHARVLLYGSIQDRYLIFGTRAGAVYGLSILHSAEAAGAHAGGVREVQECGDLLLSVLARHYESARERRSVSSALSRLDEIAGRIHMEAALPAREAEVCARLVYGMMIPGIAVDLGVAEESVKTYRKRLYRRLNISSPRELLMWYLELAPAQPQPLPRGAARRKATHPAAVGH